MPHHLLFELNLVTYILCSLVNITFTDSHTICNFLTSAFLVFFVFFFRTQSIFLKIDSYVGENVAQLHQTDNLSGK
jgi:hypothetical protein